MMGRRGAWPGKGKQSSHLSGPSTAQRSWEGVYLKFPLVVAPVPSALDQSQMGREAHASKWSSWGQVLAGKLQRNSQSQGLGLLAVPTLALVKVPMGQVVI